LSVGAKKTDCTAPLGGQIERLDLTVPVELLENGSHDEASIARRRIQAAGYLGAYTKGPSN
jgi:hypothetical protein